MSEEDYIGFALHQEELLERQWLEQSKDCTIRKGHHWSQTLPTECSTLLNSLRSDAGIRAKKNATNTLRN